MNYAMIENGVVTNLIWLHPANAAEFPQAVALGKIPAGLGDRYEDGTFLRDGQILRAAEDETLLFLDELMGGVNDVLCE